jgi:hypothetical protein
MQLSRVDRGQESSGEVLWVIYRAGGKHRAQTVALA